MTHLRLLRAARLFGTLLGAACIALAGCASAPVTTGRTTVILLPDEDGKVGAVTVSGDGGAQQLDSAFSSTSVGGAAPRSAPAATEAAVDAAYADLLKAQPPRPRTFVLNFLLDRAVLTEASKALLPEVLDAARRRKPTEITIFGHADSSGTREGNLRLSAERAQVVADWLRRSDPALDRIDVQYFGDQEPLVPTRPGVPEPRNRRAEIMIL
ncbi:OmpA family protein [Piscinibacter koreensis]|uniref:OmpA family protein n=1 Tax=Piscinibacter koreensis TaxID=2742824 RepID=A0A7Y6NL99_9BURK|nr:OmpA family protein [Schlegelella koreensis]NUZ05281.1 OmpA family protein [Schlegelella koreensis]